MRMIAHSRVATGEAMDSPVKDFAIVLGWMSSVHLGSDMAGADAGPSRYRAKAWRPL